MTSTSIKPGNSGGPWRRIPPGTIAFTPIRPSTRTELGGSTGS